MRRYVCERPKRSNRPRARASPVAFRPSDAASSARAAEVTTGSRRASTTPCITPRRPGAKAAVFEHRLRVRFQHTDPAGIVFFSNVLVFCHEAYEEFMRAGGTPLEAFIGKREQSLPLGHAEVTFKRPMRAGQDIIIRVSIGRVGDRSFAGDDALHDQAGEHLATAATVLVVNDAATGEIFTLSQDDTIPI